MLSDLSLFVSWCVWCVVSMMLRLFWVFICCLRFVYMYVLMSVNVVSVVVVNVSVSVVVSECGCVMCCFLV